MQSNTKTKRILIASIASLAIVAAVVMAAWFIVGATSSVQETPVTMTKEQAIDKLNDANGSVSILQVEELVDGQLHIGLVVPSADNAKSARIEIHQDGKLVYKSNVVKPGNMLVWAKANGAHEGQAEVTVYNVDADETDTGEKVEKSITIVAK